MTQGCVILALITAVEHLVFDKIYLKA